MSRCARKSQHRDATLIVITCEGENPEIEYFETLGKSYRNTRIQVKTLKREEVSHSAPKHVIGELDKYKKENKKKKGDEYWLVIDFDRWGTEKLSQIARLCNQKQYNLAVSNPLIELWLLLHLRNISTDEQNKITSLQKDKKQYFKKEIKKILGKSNNGNNTIEVFIPGVKNAIKRAQAMDQNYATKPWPTSLGSRVYLIAQKICGL